MLVAEDRKIKLHQTRQLIIITMRCNNHVLVKHEVPVLWTLNIFDHKFLYILIRIYPKKPSISILYFLHFQCCFPCFPDLPQSLLEVFKVQPFIYFHPPHPQSHGSKAEKTNNPGVVLLNIHTVEI